MDGRTGRDVETRPLGRGMYLRHLRLQTVFEIFGLMFHLLEFTGGSMLIRPRIPRRSSAQIFAQNSPGNG